jgi:hypothetical protein
VDDDCDDDAIDDEAMQDDAPGASPAVESVMIGEGEEEEEEDEEEDEKEEEKEEEADGTSGGNVVGSSKKVKKRRRSTGLLSWVHAFFKSEGAGENGVPLYSCRFRTGSSANSTRFHPSTSISGPITNLHGHLRVWHDLQYKIAANANQKGQFSSALAARLLGGSDTVEAANAASTMSKWVRRVGKSAGVVDNEVLFTLFLIEKNISFSAVESTHLRLWLDRVGRQTTPALVARSFSIT